MGINSVHRVGGGKGGHSYSSKDRQVREPGLVEVLGLRSVRSVMGFRVNVWNDLS